MDNGWVKIHRKVLDNPTVMKSPEHFQVWIYLILRASTKEYETSYYGNKVLLKPGQLVTSRRAIARDLDISPSKVTRVLNDFESDTLIEPLKSAKYSVITVLNYTLYQKSEPLNEPHLQEYIYINNKSINKDNIKDKKNIYKYSNKRHGFQQNDYDFDELERKLMEK